MSIFNAKSVNAEDPRALERTLGMGQVLVKTFQELEAETLMEQGVHQFLQIRFSNREKVMYDPTTGKKESRPLFFLETRTVDLDGLLSEWYCGEFYHLSDPQENIKIIKGLQP